METEYIPVLFGWMSEFEVFYNPSMISLVEYFAAVTMTPNVSQTSFQHFQRVFEL